MIRRLLRFIILAIVVGGAVFWGYNAIRERQLNINQWFVNGQILGVDVSSYQESVDVETLAEQNVQFMYIKATEGGTHVDESFAKNWSAAKVNNMLAGAYHYFVYNETGAAQAENFITTVGDLDGRLIPAIDMELTVEEVKNPPEKDVVVKGLKAMLAVLEERYDVKPLIYAQKDYYDKYLAEDFADYPKWVRNVYWPAFIDYGDDWVVWQYNDRGVLNGYSGEKYIDLNVVNSAKGLDSLKWERS